MPPAPECTDYLDCGILRIGVEYRRLDPATIEAAYEGDDEQIAELRENSPEGGFTDEGLSFHIESVEDNHEYLRFDAFNDQPHYHYVDRDAGTNTVVEFDVARNGPMIPWVLRSLEFELAEMLTKAGAAGLAARITPSVAQKAATRVAAHLVEIGHAESQAAVPSPD
jgi:hypothetical protein